MDFNQHSQFGSPSDKAACAKCEMMLADALDHTLSAADQSIFDRHLATCADCSRMYKDARRGADWLVMLKTPEPEPAADLVARILGATSLAGVTTPESAQLPQLAVQPGTVPNTLLGQPVLVAPAVYTGNVIPFRQRVRNVFRVESLRYTIMQPRLAMTAAMAFFSIALTLNLTGVRITQLRASDFTPSSLKRSFYDTNAKVMRSVDNLRVVYELESRVNDLQRHEPETTAPAAQDNSTDQQKDSPKNPDKQEQKQPAPRPRSGSSRSVTPGRTLQYTASAPFHNANPGSPLPASRLLQVSFVTPNVFRQQQGGQA